MTSEEFETFYAKWEGIIDENGYNIKENRMIKKKYKPLKYDLQEEETKMEDFKKVEVGDKENLELIKMINSGEYCSGPLITYPSRMTVITTHEHFWNERAKWSVETFGPVEGRGPLGCVRHLKKEVQEVLDHLENPPYNKDEVTNELVDCLFLIEDAAMRHGLSYNEFIEAGWRKLEKNKKRVWPKVNGDNPVEHVKGIND